MCVHLSLWMKRLLSFVRHPKTFQSCLNASATAASGSRTSPQEGGNTCQAVDPLRNRPIRLNGLVYSQNLRAVLRRVELVEPQWKISLSGSSQSKGRHLLDLEDLLAIPVDNSAENRDLRDQLIRLRRSRAANERDFYEATKAIDKLKDAFPSSLTCWPIFRRPIVCLPHRLLI